MVRMMDLRFGFFKKIFSASVKLPTYEKACNDIPFATPNDDDQNNTSDDAPQQVVTIFFLR